MKNYLAVLLVFFSCSMFEHPEDISKNHKASGCGGFSKLAKVRATFQEIDSSDYCSAEKIRWQYDKESQTLELLLTRTWQNCAAKPKMSVKSDHESRFIISISDMSNPNVQAHCMCIFVLFFEITDITYLTPEIKYKEHSFIVDLTEGSGIIVTDTASVWHCP